MALMIQGLDFRGRPRPKGAGLTVLMHAQVLYAVRVTVFTTHLHCVSASMPKGLQGVAMTSRESGRMIAIVRKVFAKGRARRRRAPLRPRGPEGARPQIWATDFP